MRAQWCISAVMDRWRSWRSRRLTSRAGARRAGVTALALFVVTAALAVLLAVLFHLAWPPVAGGDPGGVPTLPALYLAWAGAARRDQPARISRREEASLWPPGRAVGLRWSWACTR